MEYKDENDLIGVTGRSLIENFSKITNESSYESPIFKGYLNNYSKTDLLQEVIIRLQNTIATKTAENVNLSKQLSEKCLEFDSTLNQNVIIQNLVNEKNLFLVEMRSLRNQVNRLTFSLAIANEKITDFEKEHVKGKNVAEGDDIEGWITI
jgi:hypothetical protein